MSTSRFGDAEWGEQFERDDDELVDWPARDDLDEKHEPGCARGDHVWRDGILCTCSVGVAGEIPADAAPEPVNFCDESDCPSITEDSAA